jgi:hypothetical protein
MCFWHDFILSGTTTLIHSSKIIRFRAGSITNGTHLLIERQVGNAIPFSTGFPLYTLPHNLHYTSLNQAKQKACVHEILDVRIP